LTTVWHGPTPRDLERDLERLPAEVVDPFAG
jgi:hypothetical protein